MFYYKCTSETIYIPFCEFINIFSIVIALLEYFGEKCKVHFWGKLVQCFLFIILVIHGSHKYPCTHLDHHKVQLNHIDNQTPLFM